MSDIPNLKRESRYTHQYMLNQNRILLYFPIDLYRTKCSSTNKTHAVLYAYVFTIYYCKL